MTLVWTEESPSRGGTIHRIGKRARSAITRTFMVTGTYSDIEVHAYANTWLTTNRFYIVTPYKFLAESYELEHQGGDAWRVNAHYESMGTDAEAQPTQKRARAFDTTGATMHMSSGFAEKRYAASGETAPDMKCAINVNGDSVEGVEVPSRTLVWQETYEVPNTVITWDYVKTLRSLTGGVNNATFRGFTAEEVLFLGASGSQQWDDEKGDGPIQLTFKFLAGENQSEAFVSGITGINKKAHEYLWLVYRDDTTSDHRFKVPLYAYVTQTSIPKDFSTLGIGTT